MSQPTGARGRYEQPLSVRPEHASGRYGAASTPFEWLNCTGADVARFKTDKADRPPTESLFEPPDTGPSIAAYGFGGCLQEGLSCTAIKTGTAMSAIAIRRRLTRPRTISTHHSIAPQEVAHKEPQPVDAVEALALHPQWPGLTGARGPQS